MSAKTPAGRPLGINTDIASASGFVTYETIQDARKKELDAAEIFVLYLRLKWQRLATVQRLFPLRFEQGDNGKLKKQKMRVSMCHRVQIKPFIEIHYSDSRARARYGRGLMLCGSPHVCPVCKTRIAENDRGELERVDFEKIGLGVMMITVTLSHKIKDSYADVRKKIESANRRVRSGRAWKKFSDDYSIVGTVTSTESNFSFINGWHVHKHLLVVYEKTDKRPDAENVKRDFYSMYISALGKLGGYASFEHGVDVLLGDNASMVAQYIAKWGREPKDKNWTLQAELAKSPVKLGKYGESVTPDQLLDIYAMGGELSKLAGAKFVEYAYGTYRKNRLSYSRGLRSRLRMGRELSDIDAAKLPDNDTRLLALLRTEHWRMIYRLGLRSWVIVDAARSGDFVTFQNVLAEFGIHISHPAMHADMVGVDGAEMPTSLKRKK